MLDDLALFAVIVECGSLSAAARRLQLPAATVTRRLQQLERQLNCQLLHRSARRLQPTPEGLAYYERCSPLLQSLQQATQSLEATLTEVQGLVRVLAPMNLAKGLLKQVWGDFLTRYPGVRLDLRLSNVREDVYEQGADLAIRIGEQPDSNLALRRLGMTAIGLVASPDYLARMGEPAHPDELDPHAWIVSDPLHSVRIRHVSSGESLEFTVPPTRRCVVNDVALAIELAQAGQGLLWCPLWVGDEPLRSGALVRVLRQWQADANPIYAVWPQQRQLPARVRALVDMLDHCAQAEPLLQGR
ncbi:LysR family transcriptional regulator [Comamonas humi]